MSLTNGNEEIANFSNHGLKKKKEYTDLTLFYKLVLQN